MVTMGRLRHLQYSPSCCGMPLSQNSTNVGLPIINTKGISMASNLPTLEKIQGESSCLPLNSFFSKVAEINSRWERPGFEAIYLYIYGTIVGRFRHVHSFFKQLQYTTLNQNNKHAYFLILVAQTGAYFWGLPIFMGCRCVLTNRNAAPYTE